MGGFSSRISLSLVALVLLVAPPQLALASRPRDAGEITRTHARYGETHPFDQRGADGRRLPRHRRLATATAHAPIRIVPFIDESRVSLDAEHLRFLRADLLPAALRYLAKTLAVVPAAAPLAATRACQTIFQSSRKCNTFKVDQRCGNNLDPNDPIIPAAHFKPQTAWDTCSTPTASNPTSTCSGGTVTPGGGGVPDADFVLYVTARTTPECEAGSTIAYAGACQRDQHDRPTHGRVNFCPAMLSSAADKWEDLLFTALHEVAHALGFSAAHYAYMRDGENGGAPRTARDAVYGLPLVVDVACPDGTTRRLAAPSNTTLLVGPLAPGAAAGAGGAPPTATALVARIVTPGVRREARAHFGCASLAGAELENQDTGSTSTCFASHWEERVFKTELMSALTSRVTFVSRVTLAFFEDTGWYEANYTAATLPSWGYRAGCAFAQAPCLGAGATPAALPVPSEPRHFCAEDKVRRCSVSRLFQGYCSMATFAAPLPARYQYFSGKPAFGGQFQQLDYCPDTRTYTNRDCRNAADTPAVLQNFRGEAYGSDARCFDTSLSFEVGRLSLKDPAETTGCFRYRCASGGKLSVYVAHGGAGGGTWLACEDGASVKPPPSSGLALVKGAISCPASMADELCMPEFEGCPNQCSRRGTCIGGGGGRVGRCLCTVGFSGADCSLQQCAGDCHGHGNCTLDAALERRECRCESGWSGRDCSCPGHAPPFGWTSCATPPPPTPAPTPFPTPAPPAANSGLVHLRVRLNVANVTCDTADVSASSVLRAKLRTAFATHANVSASAVALLGTDDRGAPQLFKSLFMLVDIAVAEADADEVRARFGGGAAAAGHLANLTALLRGADATLGSASLVDAPKVQVVRASVAPEDGGGFLSLSNMKLAVGGFTVLVLLVACFSMRKKSSRPPPQQQHHHHPQLDHGFSRPVVGQQGQPNPTLARGSLGVI